MVAQSSIEDLVLVAAQRRVRRRLDRHEVLQLHQQDRQQHRQHAERLRQHPVHEAVGDADAEQVVAQALAVDVPLQRLDAGEGVRIGELLVLIAEEVELGAHVVALGGDLGGRGQGLIEDAEDHEPRPQQPEPRREEDIPPVHVMFLYSTIDNIGEIADIAERVGNQLELLLAK